MGTVYRNEFRPIMRKYIGNVGYSSSDGGATWERNSTPEELIKRLSYYVRVTV